MTRIAIVGCGGLGVPAAWTLGLAGAREFVLVDADTVEISNLHRQVLYGTPDLGRSKAECLASVLRHRFDANVEVRQTRVDESNLHTTLAGCDAAVEATDDAEAKFLLSDWATQRPRTRFAAIAAAIERRGQWMVVGPPTSCYRCLFEDPPPPESVATCAIAGVLGPLTGQVGAYAARALWAALHGQPDAALGALVRLSPRGFARTPVAVASDCPCQNAAA